MTTDPPDFDNFRFHDPPALFGGCYGGNLCRLVVGDLVDVFGGYLGRFARHY